MKTLNLDNHESTLVRDAIFLYLHSCSSILSDADIAILRALKADLEALHG